MPSLDKSEVYKPVKPNYLKRHVSNLIVIVPVEDQEDFDEKDSKDNDEKVGDAEEVHDDE